MGLDYVPLLRIQREIYDMPRDMARFREYLRRMMGGRDDWPARAPLVAANPMAKEHVATRLDELIAAGADEVGAAAAIEADRRLRLDLRIACVVADDVGGGWTDRHLTEAQARFEPAGSLKHGWATALLWASEPASPDRVRQEVLSTAYRAAHVLRHGEPRTLRDAMRQEGRALLFAGASMPPPAGARATLAPHLGDGRYATMFAGMYGDDAARKVGHAPLGVPPRAGFALGLEDARAEGDPVRALQEPAANR